MARLLVGCLVALAGLNAALLTPADSVAAPASAVTPLVSTDWMKAHLRQPDLVVVDVRGGTGADADFQKAHIPGAVHAAYPGIWRSPDGTGKVPPVIDLEAALGSYGVGDATTVVIVGAGSSSSEFAGVARVYWTLKYLGHDAVAILDGGFRAWTAAAGDPLAVGKAAPMVAKFTARLRPEILMTTPEVEALVGGKTILVDARSPDQYDAGHLPGAINLDNDRFFEAGGQRLRPRAELAKIVPAAMQQAGAQFVAFCNTGHWGSTDWFVLHELLGYTNVSLYAESMRGWTEGGTRPVEKRPTR
ncbi:MAG: rhodanese-like domain-containing protein [Bauldia sp.]